MDIKTKLSKCFVDNLVPDDRDLFTLVERVTDKRVEGVPCFRIFEIKIQYQKQMDPRKDISDAKIKKILAAIRGMIKEEGLVKEKNDPVRKFHVGNEVIQSLVHGKMTSRRSVLFEVDLYLKTPMKMKE